MSAPVRFLVLVATGWVGLRAATLGLIPGFTVSYAKTIPDLPPIAQTEFPPLPPVQAQFPQYAPPPRPQYAGYPAVSPVPFRVPVPYYSPYPYPAASEPVSIPPRPAWHLPSSDSYEVVSAPDEWQLADAGSFPGRRSTPAPPIASNAPVAKRLDRVQLTSWAMLRGSSTPGALASGGTLGGSQGGARLTYNFSRMLAASLRTTTPLGGSRGAEVAAGIRVTPFRSIPIAITAERRQSISRFGGGRSAFAVFAEGGVYHHPMPLDFDLDAYLQAGVVGLRSRDLFADGAFAFTRPVWGRFSAGFGVWGGAQPGLYRVDAGPRISMRIRDNIYAHVDWRQRLVGNAAPASGPAVTLGADF